MTTLAPPDPISEFISGREFRLLIGGELVRPSSGQTATTYNPSVGEPLVDVPRANADDVRLAFDAAAKAQPEWAAMGIGARCEFFSRFAASIAERRVELAMIDAVNGGMPYQGMLFDVQMSIDSLRDWPTMVRWHGGRTIPATTSHLHYTKWEPYGVVAKILAFNHPMMFTITRVLAPLLAGNAVIVKPAPQAPLSALVVAEIAREVFPPGILNVMTGGTDLGQALVGHPGIKRIGFTGSLSTGLKIQQHAAQTLPKHVSLELGGKNPMIVFPDAPFEAAVDGAVMGMNFGLCAGQSCGSNSRTYVHAEIYEDFVEAVAARLEGMEVGIAYEARTEMGPLVSADHFRYVTQLVEGGQAEGARLVTGGSAPTAVPHGGYFLRPTLFADVEPHMAIARTEIFGPVMSFFKWHDTDAVVEAANATEYGLTAGVWTRDLAIAHNLADRLQAGYVWINDSAKHFTGTPFGGVKGSGIGREESIEEYESYLEQKAVHVNLTV